MRSPKATLLQQLHCRPKSLGAALPPRRGFSAPSRINPSSASSVLTLPTVATSSLLKQTREDSLWTPGLVWRDEEQISVGLAKDASGLVESDLHPVEDGGRETSKMKFGFPLCSTFGRRGAEAYITLQHVLSYSRRHEVR